jgi:hypothetical protein
MRKYLVLPVLVAVFFTCGLYAAKDDTADRIDFTLAAGEVAQVSGATAGGTAAVLPAAQQTKKGGALGLLGTLTAEPETARKKELVPEVPSAMGFTFDLMSIARSSFDPFNLDLSFSLVFGDYGNFGLEGIYYIQFLSAGDYFGGTVGLDLAFDIFPLGNSPSGLYFGPILGGRMYIVDSSIAGDPMMFGIVPGANAGFRLNLNGFILEAGFVYGAVFTLNDLVDSPIHDFQFKLSIGGFTEQITPEMIKAKKQGGEK